MYTRNRTLAIFFLIYHVLVVLFVTFWALVSIKLVLFIVLVLFTFLFVLLVSYSRLSLLQDHIFFSRLFDTGSTDLIMNNLNHRSRIQCDFRTFFVFASIMTEAACDIEAFERERAQSLAGVMLQRARVIGRQRFRQSRPSICLSCLRDSIEACARQAGMAALLRDLSVIRRDVVRTGLSGSRRAAFNFHALQHLLRRHSVYVRVLSLSNNELVRHDLGSAGGRCCGVIFWDVERHAFPVQEHVQVELSNSPAPWTFSSVGGKRPKAKPKPTKKDSTNMKPLQHLNVTDTIQCRLQSPVDKSKCMARTFRLFQCPHKPSAVLPSGVNVCRMHLRTWRKHGLMTDTSLSHSHEKEIFVIFKHAQRYQMVHT